MVRKPQAAGCSLPCVADRKYSHGITDRMRFGFGVDTFGRPRIVNLSPVYGGGHDRNGRPKQPQDLQVACRHDTNHDQLVFEVAFPLEAICREPLKSELVLSLVAWHNGQPLLQLGTAVRHDKLGSMKRNDSGAERDFVPIRRLPLGVQRYQDILQGKDAPTADELAHLRRLLVDVQHHAWPLYLRHVIPQLAASDQERELEFLRKHLTSGKALFSVTDPSHLLPETSP